MTDKELRRLSRMELIQLLLEQTKELGHARQELAEARKAVEDRQIQIQNAGSIAEASLQINQVMEAAQKAADQYLENVQREYESQARAQYAELQSLLQELEESTRNRCAAMLQEAQRKAGGHGGDG